MASYEDSVSGFKFACLPLLAQAVGLVGLFFGMAAYFAFLGLADISPSPGLWVITGVIGFSISMVAVPAMAVRLIAREGMRRSVVISLTSGAAAVASFFAAHEFGRSVTDGLADHGHVRLIHALALAPGVAFAMGSIIGTLVGRWLAQARRRTSG
jgi:hypothetical protein